MKTYDVYDNEGDIIDTVFYCDNSNCDEVKKSLIEHDCYDYDITVKERDEDENV